MTDNQTPAEIATAYIEAWARSDMDTVAGYYADDVVLEASMYPRSLVPRPSSRPSASSPRWLPT